MTFSIVCTFGSIIYLTPYMAIPIVTLVGFYFALQVSITTWSLSYPALVTGPML